MFVLKDCHWYAVMALFVATFSVAGCGKKAEPTQTEATQGEADPKPAEPQDKPAPSVPRPVEPETLATAKPDATYTAKQLAEEQKKDGFYLISKHPGKVVDVTGVVDDLSQDIRGEGMVWVQSGESGFDQLAFPVTVRQPWLKVLPGQTVTLRVRTLNSVWEPKLPKWEIEKVEGPAPVTFAAEQYTRERAAGGEAFDVKYDNKYVILTGAVVKIDEKPNKAVTIELDAGESVHAKCQFSSASEAGVPLHPEQKALLKPGQKVKVMGKCRSNGLVFCFLLEPTS